MTAAPGLTGALLALLRRDLKLAFRRRSEILGPVIFLLMVSTLFPLGLGPDAELLTAVAPAVIWVVALLSTLLSMPQLFHGDLEDGSLEQLVIAPWPLPLLVLVKVVAHWLVSGLPVAVVAPVAAAAYGLPMATVQIMAVTLLLGTPVLSFVGAIGVALSVGLRRGGLFLALLVLPLFVPVIIFATAAVTAATEGFAPTANLYLLGAMLVLSIFTAPFAIAAGLKVSIA